MTKMHLSELDKHPRLLLQARLEPVQGQRFQPTGFADLGAATFELPGDNGESTRQMLLLESAQSVANRLEMVCWDKANNDLISPLQGLPYVRVLREGQPLTNSILEAHRLNSPYILEDPAFFALLQSDLAVKDIGAINMRHVARTVLRYDAGSVLHGVFFANKALAGGRIRMMRLLSGFIEASDALPVESGGVKNDHVDHKGGGDRTTGRGNILFHRTEYVAREITAYFNLDLASLRGYALGQATEDLLTTLALFKIRSFLGTGLRLRTACDLRVCEPLKATNVALNIPSLEELEQGLPALIDAVPHFVDPRITTANWAPKPKPTHGKGSDDKQQDVDEDGN